MRLTDALSARVEPPMAWPAAVEKHGTAMDARQVWDKTTAPRIRSPVGRRSSRSGDRALRAARFYESSRWDGRVGPVGMNESVLFVGTDERLKTRLELRGTCFQRAGPGGDRWPEEQAP